MGALKLMLVIVGLAAGGLTLFYGMTTVLIDKMGRTSRTFKPRIIPVLVALGILVGSITIGSAMGEVPAGSKGVVLRFGAVTGVTLNPGLYFVTPGFETVHLMSVQVHAYTAKAGAASRDLQDVSTEVTLNLSLDPTRVGSIYSQLGDAWGDRIIVPAVQESVKSVTARYDAVDLIQKRTVVKQDMEDLLRTRITNFGIILENVSITGFKFSQSFEEAIEQKVTAQQLAMKAENDLKRVKMEAEQQIARARAEAESLRMQKEQASELMVKLRMVEKWDGQLPHIIAGGNTLPMLDLLRAGK